MNTSSIIFVVLATATAIITLLINVILFRLKAKREMRLFSKEKLEEYESILQQYLNDNNISDSDSIGDICAKLGYSVKECENLPQNIEANISADKVICISKELSVPEKNFDTAHEIAHIIRGSAELATRRRHSFKPRDPEEQICDYFAAALLLPLSEMRAEMKAVGYHKLSKKERFQFVSEIAEKKDVRNEVVVRRIVEIKKLTAEFI